MERMGSDWTDRDLTFHNLPARERAAAGAVAKLARAYSTHRRSGWHYAYLKAADMLAPVLAERRPLVLAHAITRHPGIVGVWALLRDAGADVSAVDAIVTAETSPPKPRRAVRRRRFRPAACV